MSKQYEETINYPALLLMQINDIRMAIHNGQTASIQLENLYMLLAEDLKESIATDIESINQSYIDTEDELVKQWTVVVGHPSNNLHKTVITVERQMELNRLKTLANQMIVNKVIDMLYKKDMLLTNMNRMPSTLR